jgi:hypothetical protein
MVVTGVYLQGMGRTQEPSSGTAKDWQAGPRVPRILFTIYYCPMLWEWKSIDVSWELPMKIAAP